MASIPAGFANAELIWNVTGSPRDMTTAIGLDLSDFASDDPADVAAAVGTAATGAGSLCVATNMIAGWTFQGVTVSIQLEDGPLVGSSFTPVVGTGSGEGLPINCSILVTKRTASGGRRNRGRCYEPPLIPSENNVDQAGNLTSGALSLVQGTWDVFFTGLGDADLIPVLFHQSAPFTPTPVTGFSVSSLLATQRRRMRN